MEILSKKEALLEPNMDVQRMLIRKLDRGIDLFYTDKATPSRYYSPEYMAIGLCYLGIVCIKEEHPTPILKDYWGWYND